MTLDILQEALEAYEKAGEYPDYKRRAIHDAIVETMSNKVKGDDLLENWYGAVYIVHAVDMLNILNILTYDTYGKLAKEANGKPKFIDYIDACRELYGLESLSIGALRAGFDFLSDLWRDNEEQGSNNPDGTFLRSL